MIRRKNLTRARHTWIIDLQEDGWYVRVRIFKDQKAMCKAYSEYINCDDALGSNVRALVLQGPFRFRPRGARRSREMKRELAHVIMHKKDICTFLVAHEMQHVVLYWRRKRNMHLRRPMRWAGVSEERLCDLAGHLNQVFWNKFWRCCGFDQDKKTGRRVMKK